MKALICCKSLLAMLFLSFSLHAEILVSVEEPASGETYTGVSNLRGWAVAPSGINYVEFWVDGERNTEIAYGGARRDVARLHPTYPDSDKSGFSMAFNYSNLTPGEHTVMVRAFDNTGNYADTNSTFTVTKFHQNYFPDSNVVSTQNATLGAGPGSRITLQGVIVDGLNYDIALAWDKGRQNWTIVDIGGEAVGATGTLVGVVRDAFSGDVLPGATIRLYNASGTQVSTAISSANGDYTFGVPAGSGYYTEVGAASYLSSFYYSISVTEDETTYLETVLQVADSYSGNGTVGGSVYDAFTGNTLANVDLSIREGMNANLGTVAQSIATDSNGNYTVSLPAGVYTIEASASGYTTGHFPVVSLGGQTDNNQNGTLTPVLNEGETRIVLTWNDTVSDLDSHLTGPANDSTGDRFHVYYSAKQPGNADADLDLDDTSYYGPETTTIRTQASGTYRFSIHDYSNRDSTSSSALAGSSAQVKVYQGSRLVSTYNVPNQPGTLWTVFELTGTTITPVNTITYQSSPGSVQRPSGSMMDAALIFSTIGQK